MKKIQILNKENNPYYKDNPVYFDELISIVENHPIGFSNIIRQKFSKTYNKSFEYLNNWINSVVIKLQNPFYKLITKIHWIFEGRTDFPLCEIDGKPLLKNVIRVVNGYSNFGCTHYYCSSKCAQQAKATREKRNKTCLNRYGAENFLQTAEGIEKCRQSRLAKNAGNFHSKSALQKQIQTRIKKYGMGCNLEKMKQTMIERYGFDNASKNSDIVRKRIQTCIERYGTTSPFHSDKCQNKLIQTNIERYGCADSRSSEIIKAKKEETNLKRYGKRHVLQVDSIKEKAKTTCMQKYGVSQYSKSKYYSELYTNKDFVKAVQLKIDATKRKNNSFNKSKSEDMVFELLLEKFNVSEVSRQYKDNRYPFNCDFYIKSLDLFIECNFHWTHGSHYFNPQSQQDIEKRNIWLEKSKKSPKNFYTQALYVWTNLDIRKRETASKNNLNYLVFWTYDEAKKWCNSIVV